MKWFLKVVKNYVGFSGRATRTEFWMFSLFYAIFYFLLMMLAVITHSSGIALLVSAYEFALFLPALAVIIRRLHDTGKSGWWFLISLTGIGAIVLLVFYCLDSEPDDNKYGPNPKGEM